MLPCNAIREVIHTRGKRTGFVVGVPIAVSVTLIAHRPGHAVSKVHWHFGGTRRCGRIHRPLEGRVNSIAFGGTGEIDHGLSNCQLPLGAPEAFLHRDGVQGHLQRSWVRQTNIFRGHAYATTGNVQWVTTAIEHSG